MGQGEICIILFRGGVVRSPSVGISNTFETSKMGMMASDDVLTEL